MTRAHVTQGHDMAWTGILSRFQMVLVAAAMLSGIIIVSPAAADHNQVFELHQRGEILSLVELIDRAQAIHPGQMIEARLDEETLVYEITVYGEDDHYHEMYFDARDGRLLSEHEETRESFHDEGHHADD
ncbi:PepSY domain-containing protein [Guyparkeria sp.]|uniref:PepSY domain-containing protein n=1 Tax=Guyparkeria sp. TaxID=2035736 RepID=UPI0039708CA3